MSQIQKQFELIFKRMEKVSKTWYESHLSKELVQ